MQRSALQCLCKLQHSPYANGREQLYTLNDEDSEGLSEGEKVWCELETRRPSPGVSQSTFKDDTGFESDTFASSECPGSES